jgi:hypothetical protein
VCVVVVGSAFERECKRKRVLLGLMLQEVKTEMNGLHPSLELK